MKRFIFLLVFLFFWGNSFALTDQQKQYLLNLGIPEKVINEILPKQQVSRYDATRILNYALCYDCMLPPKYIKDQYNFWWFDKFRQQPNFYLNDIDPQDPYYYCVVSLAEKDYIHGYPTSNPVCGWNFCGSNNLTLGELYQIVLNIISPKIWPHYTIKNPEKFYQNLLSIKGSQDEKNMNILPSDYGIAKQISIFGISPYTIKNFDEFFLYQKYCNLFPQDCGFSEFGNVKKWNYTLSLLNILYKDWLISLKEALKFNPTKLVDGKILIDWLYKVKQINNCKIDNDYDKDGIPNQQDNCSYTYNPNQKDTDSDWIGDVCDYDIDNDGIKNPLWVVDDKWNIVWSKILEWKKEWRQVDNCLFTPNHSQKDTDHDWIGDACENISQSLSIWVEMVCKPLEGYAPLKTTCKAKTAWNVKKILWIYEGQVVGQDEQIDYTFNTAWDKKLQVIAIWDDGQAQANSYFHILDKSTNLDVGLQVKANPLTWPKWTKATFYPQVIWDVDYIEWDFGDGSIYKKLPNQNPIKAYSKEWTYYVIAKAIKNWEIVWKSLIPIKIYNKSQPTAYLTANPLMALPGQNVSFTIIPKNFLLSDVDYVKWDFGNGQSVSRWLSINHTYVKDGAYLVKAMVYLKNGKTIPVKITEKIIWNTNPYGAVLLSTPLKQEIWKQVNFNILPKWFSLSDVKSITWVYWDGSTFVGDNLKSNHIYSKNWSYLVKAYISLTNWQVIPVSLTQLVIGENICSNLELAKKKLHCDMDNDGIPDMCDSDIDGDGVPNLLGIIKYEKPDCKYVMENMDLQRLKQEFNLSKDGAKVDNCPFMSNSDQIDINENWVGDKCENINIWSQIESDKLVLNKDEEVELRDKLEGIEEDEIDYIEWDYGDGVIEKWWVDTSHKYGKDGVYKVKARVIKDGKVISESEITLKVGDNNLTLPPKDTDNDGIPDDKDACPTIPENYNWVEDLDGCPEIWDVPNKPILKVINCNTCPCQYADYSSPFMYWLDVQAALINPFKTWEIYKLSNVTKISY